MKTAVIGSRWFSLLMARRQSLNLVPPWRPLTFLVMYRGPGLGSMPSSVRSLIHVSEGLMSPERSAVSSLVWFRFCLGLLVSGLVIWPITRGYLWVRVCRVPRAFSLCVSARWHGWGDGVAAVALVGLVPSVLSGGASASALRLSIGSGADSWRNGSGALRPCVRADSARLRCAFFERRPMGILESVCDGGRDSSAWSVGPGTIEVRMNWGARGRSGWLPCALAQPTACEHTVGTARGAEHKKGSSGLQYDWGRPGTAAVCVHTVGSTVSGLVKVS